MWDPYADLQKFQLSNGLTVYLGTWDRPWLKVGMIVHSGSRQDPDGEEGVAHFVEHLLSENVQPWTQESARQYFQEIGGSASFGTTYYDATTYDFTVPLESDYLERALDLFGHMLMDSKIEHMVERERQVIIQEFTDKFPMRWMFDKALRRRQLLFPGTKLARSVRSFGVPESILAISKEEMQIFYDQNYAPANMSIVAVGGLKPEEFAMILERSPFGLKKSGVRTPLAHAIDHFDPPKESKLIHKISDHSLQVIDHSFIDSYAAIPGVVSPKVVGRASGILKDVLFREIRQKRGWTYGFSVTWENFKEAYEFRIQGTFPWDGLGVIEDLVDECIAQAGRNDDLISHHIKTLIMRFRITDLNGDELVNAAIDDLRLYQRVVSIKEESEAATAVTVEDVRAILQTLSRDRRYTSIANP